jgi:NADPH2:quinone reductase
VERARGDSPTRTRWCREPERLGKTNFLVPEDELADQYHRLVGHVTAGAITFEVERIPLDDVATAWQRQADGAGAKLVVVP